MTTLSEQHQAFVIEYLKSGNAPAAAKAAGLGPRSAGRLMANPDILAAIGHQRQEAIAATGATGASAEAIGRCDEAYRAAERAGNISGMVAAVKLKSELLGILDAPSPQADVDPNLLSDADLARVANTCVCGALKKPNGSPPTAPASA